ncbi:MAG: ATP synthase F1 subunit gamma [Deltaproteobacteria bacterium]|jgi:F-type H+-transporting ATPase subunit gamma|nr:ATP synthase F1 subunit gamma [Deltaproteobacteria bacterium]
MASLKDIKRHIVAVKQTQKLTRAMNMVAAAKLRSTQGRTERFRYYAEEHARLLQEISDRSPVDACSLLVPAESSDKALILVLTSDRGLCGSFNTNICTHTDRLILSLRRENLSPELYVVGRKGRDYYKRRNIETRLEMVGESGSFDLDLAEALASDMIEHFLNGQYREIWIVYTRFVSMSRFMVTKERFLPLGQDEPGLIETGSGKGGRGAGLPAGEPAGRALDYLIEPNADALLTKLIPQSLTIMVYRAMLESVTSENAARMQAMDNASKSCKDIIESLTMAYNKARQASVTSELLDIVNGAEALKG